MNIMLRLLETSTSILGPDRVEAIAGTSKKARDGHIVDMKGMDVSAFMRSGTILWSHDPDQPVGIPVSCRVDAANNLHVVLDFAPEGVSEKADEVRRLVKAGIVRNLSIGFVPVEMRPLDHNNPRGGQLISLSELLEVSFVSVPADTGAVVTARSGRKGNIFSGATFEQRQRQLDIFELEFPPLCADWERRQRQLDIFKLELSPVYADWERRQKALKAIKRLMR